MTKHLKILEYALSSVLRRRYKNFAIMVAFAFLVSTLASILFLTHALRTEAVNLLAASPELIVQRLSAGRHDPIPAAYAESIRGISGTGDVTPRYWGYYYDALTKANYTLMGIDKTVGNLVLLEGRLPERHGECAVGAGVARARGESVDGEMIMVDAGNMGVIFDIVGVFGSDSAMLTNDLILLTEADIIDFFAMPFGMATDLSVEVFNESEVQTVAAKIKRILPDTRPITKSELIRTYDMVFNWRSGMMLTIFLAAVAAFCIMAWDKATGLSAEEKQEIGILKAVGWDTSDVLELKFWEGMVVALTSFIFGTILGYIHVFHFGAPLLSSIMKGWSVLFPEFRLAPDINPYHLVVLAFLTVVPYVFSTVAPSWKAAITDPEKAMRG